MKTASTSGIERSALLGLGAAVLLAHLAILQMAPMRPSLRQPEGVATFITRTIALEPAALSTTVEPTVPTFERAAKKAPAVRPDNAATTSAANSGDTAPLAAQVSSAPDAMSAAAEPPPNPAHVQLAAAAISATPPGSTRLMYQVFSNRFPYRLKAELHWRNTGNSYDARLELHALGLTRFQTSRGLLTAQGLAPIRFSDKFRSEVAAHFNREKGVVTFSANTPDAPLLAGAQDRLSIMLQLGSMIADAPSRYPANTVISAQTIGPRDADTWSFTILNEETLALPGGELATLKLIRNPREPFDQTVELWLAPKLGYLPARIRITESNGDHVDQQWLASETLQ